MGLIFSNREIASNKTTEQKEKEVKTLFNIYRSPIALGHYSKAFFAGELCFLSGQIGLDVNTMELVEGSVKDQARQVCRNISYVLDENGLSLKDVVKTTIYLKNMDDFKIVNEVYKNYFVLKPARSTVQVSALPKDALIEIEVIAKR